MSKRVLHRSANVSPSSTRGTSQRIPSFPSECSRDRSLGRDPTLLIIRRTMQGARSRQPTTPSWRRVTQSTSVDPTSQTLRQRSEPRTDATLDLPLDSLELQLILYGAPTLASLAEAFPSHLGLHHHAEGNRAGYALDGSFLPSRSTVPAQRASMFGVLAKVAHRLGTQLKNGDPPGKIAELVGKEGEHRKRTGRHRRFIAVSQPALHHMK